MKVYILLEQFEKDYQFHDGYINGVFERKENAENMAKMLRTFNEKKDYTCKVIERDVE